MRAIDVYKGSDGSVTQSFYSELEKRGPTGILALNLFRAAELGIRWGWKEDPAVHYHSWVLYVDLPQGQISFHSDRRLAGPEYPGEWDGRHVSAERIIAFCEMVMTE